MSENYSNENFDLKSRSKKLLEVMSQKDILTEEEIKTLENRSNDAVDKFADQIKDDVSLAIALTNGGLVYKDGENRYFLGVTEALLAKTIETAYQVKSDFMKRDEDKQPAIYESFTNEYFDKMFGKNGYKQLFLGDGKGFIKDFMRYGATLKEITDFDRIISKSVDGVGFDINDWYFVDKLSKKIEQGRKTYESVPQEYLEQPTKQPVNNKLTSSLIVPYSNEEYVKAFNAAKEEGLIEETQPPKIKISL